MFTLLDLRVSSLRRGHANIIWLVPSLTCQLSNRQPTNDQSNSGSNNAWPPRAYVDFADFGHGGKSHVMNDIGIGDF